MPSSTRFEATNCRVRHSSHGTRPSAMEETWQECPLTNRWSRAVAHRGRTVLAMDCVLAGAEWQHGRPLNEIVRPHENMRSGNTGPSANWLRLCGRKALQRNERAGIKRRRASETACEAF